MVVAIIAGSRVIRDYDIVERAINHYTMFEPSITEVISGGAMGVDTLAVDWARNNHIPEGNIHIIRPDYKKYDPHIAPLIRNERMAQIAKSIDKHAALVAIWHPDELDIKKGGTAHMILMAHKYGLRVYVEIV